ncbi:hypothetical protein SERLA73DRAFT_79613 [Serpula lacrymans var. lacrymans S7.3]|uniref:Uncharacterized protein n=1 Tax=Serpula lacrymans var. lacrymans (strain S7.3) TaxID=936435 RepID=F8QGZ8_SERL3|nr:hypothetical protein SERLA73DRAFT_79613 [Serpula lacrymans var. lacrymans S7.3]
METLNTVRAKREKELLKSQLGWFPIDYNAFLYFYGNHGDQRMSNANTTIATSLSGALKESVG